MKRIMFLVVVLIYSLGFGQKTLSESAILLTKDKVIYDGSYFSIPYPNGDVPSNKGVCTNVI